MTTEGRISCVYDADGNVVGGTVEDDAVDPLAAELVAESLGPEPTTPLVLTRFWPVGTPPRTVPVIDRTVPTKPSTSYPYSRAIKDAIAVWNDAYDRLCSRPWLRLVYEPGDPADAELVAGAITVKNATSAEPWRGKVFPTYNAAGDGRSVVRATMVLNDRTLGAANPNLQRDTANTLVHEFGHAAAHLSDMYRYDQPWTPAWSPMNNSSSSQSWLQGGERIGPLCVATIDACYETEQEPHPPRKKRKRRRRRR